MLSMGRMPARCSRSRSQNGDGPGRTARVIHETLGPSPDARIWLDYDQWLQNVIR